MDHFTESENREMIKIIKRVIFKVISNLERSGYIEIFSIAALVYIRARFAQLKNQIF